MLFAHISTVQKEKAHLHRQLLWKLPVNALMNWSNIRKHTNESLSIWQKIACYNAKHCCCIYKKKYISAAVRHAIDVRQASAIFAVHQHKHCIVAVPCHGVPYYAMLWPARWQLFGVRWRMPNVHLTV